MINLNMGGYAVYVWSAYFITLFVFGLNLIFSFIEHRKIKKRIKKLHNPVSEIYES